MNASFERTALSVSDAERLSRMQVVANDVGHVLMERGLPCYIWSGLQATMLGGRVSHDVDVWVPDDVVLPAYEALRRSELEQEVVLEDFYDDRVMIKVGQDLEIMSQMDIKTSLDTYPMRFTRSVRNLGAARRYSGWLMSFAPPEDTILLKAILGRGRDVGKHDLSDIELIGSNMHIDQDYLMRRTAETGAACRVSQLLIDMNIAISSARPESEQPCLLPPIAPRSRRLGHLV
jgi:hypothetical protein